MSIAVSVIVRPSRLLRWAVACMSALLLVTAVLLLIPPGTGERLVFRHLSALVCVAAAIALFFRRSRLSNVSGIDISGTGVIRLHHTGRVAADARVPCSDGHSGGEVVQLLKDSTLWSSMLLLRLRSANGQVHTVIVLPDSMDAEAFRLLSMACRWIAHQDLVPGT